MSNIANQTTSYPQKKSCLVRPSQDRFLPHLDFARQSHGLSAKRMAPISLVIQLPIFFEFLNRCKLFLQLNNKSISILPEVQLESEAKFEDLVNPTRFTVAIYHPRVKRTYLINTCDQNLYCCGLSISFNDINCQSGNGSLYPAKRDEFLGIHVLEKYIKTNYGTL